MMAAFSTFSWNPSCTVLMIHIYSGKYPSQTEIDFDTVSVFFWGGGGGRIVPLCACIHCFMRAERVLAVEEELQQTKASSELAQQQLVASHQEVGLSFVPQQVE